MWREKTVGLVSSKNAWNLTISCSQSATQPASERSKYRVRELSWAECWSGACPTTGTLPPNIIHTRHLAWPCRENSPLWLLVHFSNLSISIKKTEGFQPLIVLWGSNVKWQILLREKQLRYNFLRWRKNSITRYHPVLILLSLAWYEYLLIKLVESLKLWSWDESLRHPISFSNHPTEIKIQTKPTASSNEGRRDQRSRPVILYFSEPGLNNGTQEI